MTREEEEIEDVTEVITTQETEEIQCEYEITDCLLFNKVQECSRCNAKFIRYRFVLFSVNYQNCRNPT